jgi:phosphate transport system ATP-binding protein
MSNAPTKLETRNLVVTFGEKKVLKEVSLAVPANTVTALMGPSGCGKSTLLRAMNRMHDLVPTAKVSGEILLDNVNINAPGESLVELRRRVGMVFQRPNPFPKSIFDNVAFGLRINNMASGSELEGRVEESLMAAGLWDEVSGDLKKKSGMDLSGGQQQRLCIARTVAVEPEVILMDEPCSALDPISTAKIEELMKELRSRFTLIVVTHNLQQAHRVSDLSAFMYIGELIEFGDTASMFSEPKHDLTRNYIRGTFG